MIRATITHELPASVPPDVENDIKLFLDMDMEVLSWPDAEYDRYAAQIRREYSHLEESHYRQGRIAVLRAFEERERIYFNTGGVWEERERKARENMAREIVRLGTAEKINWSPGAYLKAEGPE